MFLWGGIEVFFDERREKARKTEENNRFVSSCRLRSRGGIGRRIGGGRPPIPRYVRHEVYRRDGYKCNHCGSSYNLQIDHVVPRSHSGPDHITNYQTLCETCNKSKGNRFIG